MIKNRWFLIAALFSFVGSLRFYFLPEIQLFIFFVFTVICKDKKPILLYVLSVLCTSVYAIPDIVYRTTPDIYPSFYTKAIISSL
jgi:hypothetical protein